MKPPFTMSGKTSTAMAECPTRRAAGLFAYNSWSAAWDFWSISPALAARAFGVVAAKIAAAVTATTVMSFGYFMFLYLLLWLNEFPNTENRSRILVLKSDR
jgi:hypothetical protein